MTATKVLLCLIINLILFFNLAAQEQTADNKPLDRNKYSVDLRVDPLLLLFKDVDIAAEIFITDHSSLELMFSYITKDMGPLDPLSNSILFITDGISYEALYKYYVIPHQHHSGLFLGPYFRYRKISGASRNNFASMTNKRSVLGACAGYKYMFTERLSLELMLGLGYAITNEFNYSRTFSPELDFDYTYLDVLIRLPLSYRF